VSLRDFGKRPLSKVNVNFQPQATLPGGGDATRATSITCTPAMETPTTTRSRPAT
jgi:hypothetical protein